jgi:hypothetical protein
VSSRRPGRGGAGGRRDFGRGTSGGPANYECGRIFLAGLILAHVISRTTGIPVVDPEPEAVDAVGVATDVVEALGVLVALGLTHPLGRHLRLTHLQEVPL